MPNRPIAVLDASKPDTHGPRQDRRRRRDDRFKAPRARDQRAATRRRTSDWLADAHDDLRAGAA